MTVTDPYDKLEATEMTRSSRDPDDLRKRLETWFSDVFGAGSDPVVGDVSSPSANGMSSETLLFDLTATDPESGLRSTGAYVARVAPDMGDVPVFPHYDLAAQYRLLRLVDLHTDVPVPVTRWLEPDPAPLGAPFFVMERIHGRVPPDVMPYTMEGWLLEADAADRRRLQDASVRLLADLHALDLHAVDLGFLELDVPGETALHRHFENQRRYYEWVREGRTHPIIEATFEWLEENWPQETGDAVVSWGDSRIGNVIYDGFDPVAVLDWEMASIAPRGVDLGWMVFLHLFFQDLTESMGLPGLPDFMRAQDAQAVYEERAGVELGDLRWYEVYAGLRHAIVMARVYARTVHFGEAEWSDDPDEVIPHRGVLAAMLDGTYVAR